MVALQDVPARINTRDRYKFVKIRSSSLEEVRKNTMVAWHSVLESSIKRRVRSNHVLVHFFRNEALESF